MTDDQRDPLDRLADELRDAARRAVPVDTGALKWAIRVPVSIEQMLAAGAITEEEARARGWTPRPPVPRLRRWRWRLQAWWYNHRPRVHFGPCDPGDDYL